MIECFLLPIERKYHDNEKKKYGIYSGRALWSVKGFGDSIWGVMVRIGLNYNEVKEECEADQKIVEQCIEYLNTPLKSKYGKRRKRKSKYKFDSKPYSYKIVEGKDNTYISALLLTKEKKKKYFWGEGFRK